MRIILFGKLADLAGREVELDGPVAATVAELRAAVARQRPELAGEILQPSNRACVGDTLVPDTHPLLGVTHVEFFPPVSGG